MIAQMAASRSVLNDYVALMKPRIISLLVLTALGAMFVAAEGAPDPTVVVLVLVGGSLAAGGAHALNHYFERDIDGLMSRTRNRPVASGRVPPANALAFGIALNVVAFVLLALLVNMVSAAVTLSGTLFYILVYTLSLKRTTPQNIVIGGAAGAVPPVVGWAAVTGAIDLPAIYMFAIIFLWTPPHFWALSLLIKDDYAKAGIPMMPVVTSVERTKRYVLFYTAPLVIVTLMFAATTAVGWLYFVVAACLGAVFVYRAARMLTADGLRETRRTYLYSLLYLALLFGAMMIDSMVF